MPVTYTNRKGTTYTLCQGETKSGKPRYSFVRDPKGRRVLEAIPKGWEISESVNGIVSLVRKRPQQLLPDEIAAVEEVVRRHPESHRYRVDVKHDRVEVYQSTGPDPGRLVSDLAGHGFPIEGKESVLREILERWARFTLVLRFVLQDEEKRLFRAQRSAPQGSADDWVSVGTGSVEQLARRLL